MLLEPHSTKLVSQKRVRWSLHWVNILVLEHGQLPRVSFKGKSFTESQIPLMIEALEMIEGLSSMLELPKLCRQNFFHWKIRVKFFGNTKTVPIIENEE